MPRAVTQRRSGVQESVVTESEVLTYYNVTTPSTLINQEAYLIIIITPQYGPPGSNVRTRASLRQDSGDTLTFPWWGPPPYAPQSRHNSPAARPRRRQRRPEPPVEEPEPEPEPEWRPVLTVEPEPVQQKHVSFAPTASPEPSSDSELAESPAVPPNRLRTPGPPPEAAVSPLPRGLEPYPGFNVEWDAFLAADRDHSGSIDPDELRMALINIPSDKPFDPVTVQMLFDIFDLDRNNVITFPEFRGILKYINEWRQVFEKFDRDGSKSIDRSELKTALRSFQYKLPRHIIKLIHNKYTSRIAESVAAGSTEEGICFDSFLRACVSVEKITKKFFQLDADHDGKIKFNLDQFMVAVLSADET